MLIKLNYFAFSILFCITKLKFSTGISKVLVVNTEHIESEETTDDSLLNGIDLISNISISVAQFPEVPIVRVKEGEIRGIRDTSLNGKKFFSYMGIPYAKSPEGKLRFKDPVPMESWDGILNCTKLPVSCLKGAFNLINYKDGENSTTIYGREDCLYLSIYTSAANERARKLPVMVFIHGGGFISGQGNFQPHVLMNRDIVLVVIQYRLGIFGFLSTEDSVMPGNMGLKDQQLALKWTKENIEVFGGDSNRITIFGQSAGGASVHYQILSPGSKGLFSRAILQSGTSFCPRASNRNHRRFAEETGREFNCFLDFGTEKYLDCMQNVLPYYLLIASKKTNIWGLSPFYVLPRVDGEFIPEAPEILMKEGKYNKVDIVAGITRDDGSLDLNYNYYIPSRRENFNKNFEKYGPVSLYFQDEENSLNLTKQVYQHYFKREDFNQTEEDWKESVEMNSDRMFKVCYDIAANFFAADPDVKLYTYHFDHLGKVSFRNKIPGFTGKKLIVHTDDLIYLNNMGEENFKLKDADDLKMRDIFLDLWVNFSKTGNPTPPGSEFLWQPATSESFQHLSLTTTPVMKEDNFKKQREFWSSLKTYQNSLLFGNHSKYSNEVLERNRRVYPTSGKFFFSCFLNAASPNGGIIYFFCGYIKIPYAFYGERLFFIVSSLARFLLNVMGISYPVIPFPGEFTF